MIEVLGVGNSKGREYFVKKMEELKRTVVERILSKEKPIILK